MKPVSRTLSFFSTWTAEFVGHPALMITLILGPFLVLFLFGQAVDITRINPRIVVVQQVESEEDMQPLPEGIDEHVTIVDQTTDLSAAVGQLRDGEIDGVAVLPLDPEGMVQDGSHVSVQVYIDDVDPLRRSFTEAYLNDQVSQLNQQTIASTIEQVQVSSDDLVQYIDEAREYIDVARSARGDVEAVREQIARINEIVPPLQEAAGAALSAAEGVSFVLPGVQLPMDDLRQIDETADRLASRVDSLEERLDSSPNGGSLPSDQELDALEDDLTEIEEMARQIENIPPEVLGAPFQLELQNVAPFREGFTGFYAPAVLALLVQHVAISLAALSMVRIRLLGLVALLKVAPVRAVEVVNGNYLAFGLVIIIIGLLLAALMHLVLPVPIHGEYWQVAATIGALVFVSLGAGFVISLASSTEQQAAQLAMLILLASVFFSGIVIALDRITWPLELVSYLLPATYATRALQDVMLRGILRHPEDLIVMLLAGIVLYALTVILLRREFRPR